MARRSSPAFLRLVHSGSTPQQVSETEAAGRVQESFLPSGNPNTLIFLAWDRASADDLMDIFELSRPKMIFDLRVAPRFDLGQLTRRAFFKLLQEYDCQYIDLLGRIGADSLNSAITNPALVASEAVKFTEKLRNPNAGPIVFFHDDDLIDDAYSTQLSKALPCGLITGWQVYRPLGSAESRRRSEGPGQLPTIGSDEFLSTPLVRRSIFISHATPEDNAFVLWLSAKLTSAGYEVWCDVDGLYGGDGFWGKIEDTIRFQAAKFLFVQSQFVKNKSGTRKEAYLALKVGEKNKIPRFIVPMQIDDTPFDETLIELIDLQAIDCRRDWMSGLRSLIAVLQRDGIPRSEGFKADQFSRLVGKFGRPSSIVAQKSEQVVSNFLPILSLPERLNFFSCDGVQSNRLPEIASQILAPAYAYYTHVATTATQERFERELASIGIAGVRVKERASLPWADFINGESGDLPSWRRADARNNAFKLLNKAWSLHLFRQNVAFGELANGRSFAFFADKVLPDNKIQFENYSGKLIRRQLVGFSAKRRVYWHFGVHAKSVLLDGDFFFALTPHVTFSLDGTNLLASKAQLHSLRRSFCRSWWNDRWRDLLQGFVAVIAKGEASIRVDVGGDTELSIDSKFYKFVSPVSLESADHVEVIDGAPADEVIEDEWDEVVGEEEAIFVDGSDGLGHEP